MKRQGFGSPIGRPGDDRLSHEWARSTIGAQGFHGRVRNGFGWGTPGIATRSARWMRRHRIATKHRATTSSPYTGLTEKRSSLSDD